MKWFKTLDRVKLYDNEWSELYNSLSNLETSCAMRVVQMAGPALERCNVGAYNCAYLPLNSLKAFSELLYVLMQGTGVGFSVEDSYISQLPRVKHQLNKSSTSNPKYIRTYIISDDTEGWCDALLFGMESWFDGYDVIFDLSLIRPKGSILRTKGGRSSGPEPLYNLLMFTRNIILSRQGKILTDLNCHDIACMIGKIVQVGGVRRAATISFSDLESTALRDCKSGNWYLTDVQRTMANNSAVYDERPDIDTFINEFSALIKSKSGERGIFNTRAVLDGMPERREKRSDIRANPCAEINLRPNEFCNLSITVARPNDTEETLMKKVRLATYWGCMQKTATNFNYLNPEWKKNCEEEALIGVDITGHADCPLLRFGAPGRSELLRKLRTEVDRVDLELSKRFGVNRSAANTCVKPSGDSGVFFNCASGCSPWFNDYILRYVREQAGSPVAILLESEGVPCATAPEDPSLKVFGFLIKAPEGATKRDGMTALDQLNNWLEWKENWAEHSVSCTIYVNEEEWPDVIAWCWKNFNKISGLSFLPRDNGIYAYAPNTAITKEQYELMLQNYPTINWAKLARLEKEDNTLTTQTYACTAGGCNI
jgi:ribonucleoside-diphosphate reductase alpha chain